MPERVGRASCSQPGRRSRFGGAKQKLLLPSVLARLAGASVDDIVVVLGAHRFRVEGARTVEASGWERGPGASLRAGLAALDPTSRPPSCASPTARCSRRRRSSGCSRPGWAALESSSQPAMAACGAIRWRSTRPAWAGVPDDGGRLLDAVLVPCDDLGSPGDVDTPADLRRLSRFSDGAVGAVPADRPRRRACARRPC